MEAKPSIKLLSVNAIIVSVLAISSVIAESASEKREAEMVILGAIILEVDKIITLRGKEGEIGMKEIMIMEEMITGEEVGVEGIEDIPPEMEIGDTPLEMGVKIEPRMSTVIRAIDIDRQPQE
jgi:hypothetical protein